MSRKLKAVLFDVDGTLIDSNDAHTRAWQEAFAYYGYSLPFSLIRSKIGMAADHIIPELIHQSSKSDLGKKIDQFRGQTFTQDYLPTLKPFPYAQQLVQYIHAAGIKTIAASSASKEDLQNLLGKIGVSSYFYAKTDSDQVENSKPSPDIIEEALRQAGVSPKEALLLGDTPYDIEAAHRCRVRVIAFTCGGFSPAQLAPAERLMSGPEELFRRLGRYPANQTAAALSDVLESDQSQVFL